MNEPLRLVYPEKDEEISPNQELTVTAQPGDEPAQFVFRRPGRRVILFRPSSITEKLVLGQLVSGKVSAVRERSILLDPTGVLPAVEWDVQATRENIEPGYPPVGFIKDPNAQSQESKTICVRFVGRSPKSKEIVLGASVRGPCLDHTGTLAYVYPAEVRPSPEPTPGQPPQPFRGPNLHGAVPWILDQLPTASRGELPPEVLGFLGVEADWEAFELLTEIAFRILQIGTVKPLGFKARGPVSEPDGRVYCPSFQQPEYAIIYDAKQRRSGLGTLKERMRSLQTYITDTNAPAKFLVIVSSQFGGDDLSRMNVPDATTVFLTAEALALLATYKVMNPRHAVSATVRKLLESERIIDHGAVERWASKHHLEDLLAEAMKDSSAARRQIREDLRRKGPTNEGEPDANDAE